MVEKTQMQNVDVKDAWEGFRGKEWKEEIDIREFIQDNFTPYDGDQSFLEGPTEATTKLNDKLIDLKLKERAHGGPLEADTKVVSTITSHKPGYLDKSLEKIVGLQTVALYGIDRLIEEKKKDLENCGDGEMTNDIIQMREEISDQIKALNDMKIMAESYGYDISKPATTAKEAIQWLYFGYLASIKQQNGAAMSIGRIDSFIDIYIERDMKRGLLNEKEAQ